MGQSRQQNKRKQEKELVRMKAKNTGNNTWEDEWMAEKAKMQQKTLLEYDSTVTMTQGQRRTLIKLNHMNRWRIQAGHRPITIELSVDP